MQQTAAADPSSSTSHKGGTPGSRRLVPIPTKSIATPASDAADRVPDRLTSALHRLATSQRARQTLDAAPPAASVPLHRQTTTAQDAYQEKSALPGCPVEEKFPTSAASPSAELAEPAPFHLIVPASEAAPQLPHHLPPEEIPGSDSQRGESSFSRALRSTLGGPASPVQPETSAEPQRPVAKNPQDRRAFPRRIGGCVVAVCRRSRESQLTPQHIDWILHRGRLRGHLVDISMNGAAFTLQETVEVGETLLLRITNRNSNRAIDTDAKVLRVAETEHGYWKIYCRLERKLTFDEIRDLGQPPLPSSII